MAKKRCICSSSVTNEELLKLQGRAEVPPKIQRIHADKDEECESSHSALDDKVIETCDSSIKLKND